MGFAVSKMGVNVTDVFTPWSASSSYTTYQTSTNNPPSAPGERVVGTDNSEWVYVYAATAITGAGYVCTWNASFEAGMLSTSNDAGGLLVGVAMAAIPQYSYGWLQVKGPASVRVAASTPANAALATTATAGQLDTAAGATGSFVVQNLFLGTAQGAGGAGVNTSGRLNYPILAAAAI